MHILSFVKLGGRWLVAQKVFYTHQARGFAGLQPLADDAPVDQCIEHGLDLSPRRIPGAQVIGVLPDIDAQQRRVVLGDRIVTIGRRHQDQLACGIVVVQPQPDPEDSVAQGVRDRPSSCRARPDRCRSSP